MGGRDLFFPPPASGTEPEGAKPHEQSTRPGPDLGDERFSPEETDASGPGHGRGAAGTGDETASGPDRRPAGQGAMLGEQLRVFAESLGDGHLSVRGTTEGLVIELGDLADEPLFAPGSAEPTPVLEGLLAVVVPVLGDSINPIALIGHTDARPFSRGGRYSNWELSADRANAARRLMLAEGLAASRIVRIVGKAATEPRLPDPLDPRNRRIAIKLLEMPR
jgi:chemotaxis protein MotB